MRINISHRARRQYEALSPRIQQQVDKQFAHLLTDLRHPSLRAKKYDERQGIWQGRVTRDWRFYFTIEGDTYEVLLIIPHPK